MVIDCAILDSYRTGKSDAANVYDGEPLPTAGQLVCERMASLLAEYPAATYGERYQHAVAWADGWLAVADVYRSQWESARAQMLALDA